jgi:hypothetical protein
MRQINLILLLIIFNTHLLHAQVNPGPNIAWQQCYGGSAEDFFTDAIILEDGKIMSVIVYYSNESEYYGSWLVKYNESFNELWRVYIGDEYCGSTGRQVKVSTLNNYMVLGNTGGCLDSIGGNDLIVVCIDEDGSKLWSRSYGSTQGDDSHTLLPTSDGGFLVGGSTRGFDGDLYMPAWNDLFYDDALIMKMDSLGEVEWVDIVGGTIDDAVLSNFLEVAPNQFMVMIGSSSSDFDLAGSDVDDLKKYLLRVYDIDGNVLKEHIISAEDNLIAWSNEIMQLPDGKILVCGAGTSHSEINPTFPEHGSNEGAIGVINDDLELIDLYLYGGIANEYFLDIIPASMGGYYCLGYSGSNDGDLPGNHGSTDLWVLHLDEAYNLIWSKNVGSAGTDLFTSQAGALIEKGNMLYMFNQVSAQAGIPTGDLTCGDPSTNKVDAWLVALDLSTVGIDEVEPNSSHIQLFPNPVTQTLTIQLPEIFGVTTPYTILDITGVILEAGQFQQQVNQLNLANYPKGFFIINIYLNDQLYCHVFIKE